MDEDCAECFVRSIRYDDSALQQAAFKTKTLLTACEQPLRILDIGIGDGAFSLPFVAGLACAPALQVRLACFDISRAMLARLQDNLTKYPAVRQSITWFCADARDSANPAFAAGPYDLIVLTFVLHYIDGWQRVIDSVADALRPGGLFVQAEIIGDMRLVDGAFGQAAPRRLRSFWEEYFALRSSKAQWAPTVSVTNLEPVYTYCTASGCFRAAAQEDFIWTRRACWADFCRWIAGGPVSSLAAGLTRDCRVHLAAAMEDYLARFGTNPQEVIELQWGLRITWLRRAQ